MPDDVLTLNVRFDILAYWVEGNECVFRVRYLGEVMTLRGPLPPNYDPDGGEPIPLPEGLLEAA